MKVRAGVRVRMKVRVRVGRSSGSGSASSAFGRPNLRDSGRRDERTIPGQG